MKPLKDLNNVERARLLHSLFPAEIPAFLAFTLNLCAATQENEKDMRQRWDNPIISFNQWLTLVQNVEAAIKKYGPNSFKSRYLFSDQLFDGYNALYLSHCLHQYISRMNQEDRKFAAMVQILFSPSI